jgi:hypothetical protein
MGSDSFLFVNAGNALPSGHKASGSATRSFVMRKARADRAWSTKTHKLVERSKRGHDCRSEGMPEVGGGRNVTDLSAAASRPVACLHKRTNEIDLARGRFCNSRLVDVCEYYEGPFEETIRAEWTETSSHSRLCRTCQRPRMPVRGTLLPANPGTRECLDPFDSLAVPLDTRSSTLLVYCASSNLPPVMSAPSTC